VTWRRSGRSVGEWRLYGDEIPECATAEWYRERDAAPHLEQEGHRERLLLTAEMVEDAVRRPGIVSDICDLGAGDGGLLQAVRERGIRLPAWGYDLQPTNVKAAIDRGVNVQLADFDIDPVRWADVVVASEVIEHLPDPHAFIRWVAASPARFFVATSPYTETPGNAYEHHLWAWDLVGYRQLLEQAGWVVLRQETAWISQILLCGRP
jgi:methyltransferase family protein